MVNRSMNQKNEVVKITHDKNTDIPTFMKRLLMLLGLLYLMAIPTGMLGEKRKLEPVDVGFLVVLVVINSNVSLKDTVERISLLKVGAFEAELKAKVEELEVKLDYQTQQQKEQDRIDAEAKNFVGLQLSETSVSVNPKDLFEKIKLASSSAKETIYIMAKEARRDAEKYQEGENKKIGLIERTVPVFQALINSGYEISRYRFHAQLGYALMNQQIPDWRRARYNLNKAIKLWQNKPGKGASAPLPPLYCFNWVICAAKLNEAPTLPQHELYKRIKLATTCPQLALSICKGKHQDCKAWIDQYRDPNCPICCEFNRAASSRPCQRDYDDPDYRRPVSGAGEIMLRL